MRSTMLNKFKCVLAILAEAGVADPYTKFDGLAA